MGEINNPGLVACLSVWGVLMVVMAIVSGVNIAYDNGKWYFKAVLIAELLLLIGATVYFAAR